MQNPNELKLETLLRTILGSICQATPSLVLRYDDMRCEFQVQVHAKDQGRVVGKGGKVITAIKEIMWYAGLKQIQRTCGVELMDPEPFRGDTRNPPFHFDLNWNYEPMRDLLLEILQSSLKLSATFTAGVDSEGVLGLQISMQDARRDYLRPDLGEAIKTVVHAAVMSSGGKVNTEVLWK